MVDSSRFELFGKSRRGRYLAAGMLGCHCQLDELRPRRRSQSGMLNPARRSVGFGSLELVEVDFIRRSRHVILVFGLQVAAFQQLLANYFEILGLN